MAAARRRGRTATRMTAWWSVGVMVLAGLALVAAPPASATGRVLVLTAPASVVAGVPFDVTVTVRSAGRHAPAYVGTVSFTTDDALARVLPADYTFTAADRGTHTFTGVTLVGTGRHTLTVRDTGHHRLRDSDRIRVTNAGAAIHGQLLCEMDPADDGGIVTVYDAVTGLVLASGPADLPGTEYHLTGLPAGAVKIGAVVPGAYAPDFANNRDTLEQADVFVLRPGQTLVQSWEVDTFGPYLDVQRIWDVPAAPS